MTISLAMSARTLLDLSPAILVFSLDEVERLAMPCAGDTLLMAATANVAKLSPVSNRSDLLTVFITETMRNVFICRIQLLC
jgi:hypothetical protein